MGQILPVFTGNVDQGFFTIAYNEQDVQYSRLKNKQMKNKDNFHYMGWREHEGYQRRGKKPMKACFYELIATISSEAGVAKRGRN